MKMSNLNTFLFFALQRIIGSRVKTYYREFLQLEKKTSEEIRQLQQQRLKALLKHAAQNIPFYKLEAGDKPSLELHDFPILTKVALRERYHELMINSLREEYRLEQKPKKFYSWTEVKTGGSTGIPTSLIHDQEFRDRGRASRLYSQYLCGFPIGKPYFRLWGSMREINQMQDSLPQRVMRFLSGEKILNAFKMGDQDIAKYIEILNGNDMTAMMAYVDAACQIAKYSLKHEIPVYGIQSIMACAGTVTEDMRQTLKKAFGATIHNKYGSRDCADMGLRMQRRWLPYFCK